MCNIAHLILYTSASFLVGKKNLIFTQERNQNLKISYFLRKNGHFNAKPVFNKIYYVLEQNFISIFYKYLNFQQTFIY